MKAIYRDGPKDKQTGELPRSFLHTEPTEQMLAMAGMTGQKALWMYRDTETTEDSYRVLQWDCFQLVAEGAG